MNPKARKARRLGYGRFPGLLDPVVLHALRDAVFVSLAHHGAENIVAIQCDIMPHPLVAQIRTDPALLDVASELLGAPAEPSHADVLRIVPPGASPTLPHKDAEYISRFPLWIAWMPLADCPREHGPLVMNPAAFRHELPCSIGDVIFFSSLTEHAALPNRSQFPRISIDFRYGIAEAR